MARAAALRISLLSPCRDGRYMRAV